MLFDKPGHLLQLNKECLCLWRTKTNEPTWINRGEHVLFLGLYSSKLSGLKACFLTLRDGYVARCEVGNKGTLVKLEEMFSFPLQFNTLTDNPDKIKL